MQDKIKSFQNKESMKLVSINLNIYNNIILTTGLIA